MMIRAMPAITTAAAMKIATSSVLVMPPELLELAGACTVTGPVLAGVVVVGVVAVDPNSGEETPVAPVAAPALAGNASATSSAVVAPRWRKAVRPGEDISPI
jgi:hypothetical protein